MPPLSRRLINWAAAFEDGALIRAAFFGLLSATAVILYLDYTEMMARNDMQLSPQLTPILPAYDPAAPDGKPGPAVTTPVEVLDQPLVVKLGSAGVLSLTGTFDPGSAQRVADEIAAHGEYVRSVALDSPGGSITDALAIGQLIRDKGFGTTVAAGALCASSCPLVFAGGREREANSAAAIGVHQIYAATVKSTSLPERLAAAGAALSDAQRLTADITRYLEKMGLSQEVWLHALETPPDRLYYFSAEELVALKVVTKLTN
jgi:hypothetical protein